MHDSLRVSLLGGNELIREGLRRILSERGFVIGQTHARAADLLVHEGDFGLLVVDATDFDQGLAECRLLRQATDARIVLMVDDCDASDIIAAFGSNIVDGLLNKAVACEPLAGILRLVALGEKYFPPQTLGIFGQSSVAKARLRGLADKVPNLSGREIQILGCLTDGDSNKLISRRLQIADATVKVHVKAILRKLHVKNRTQAAIWAADHILTNGAMQSALAA